MRRPSALVLRTGERALLERLAGSGSGPGRVARRARAILLAADGLTNREIAASLGMHYNRVGHWRRRFEQGGVGGLEDRERSGRPSSVGQRELVALARLVGVPSGKASRWSTKELVGAMTEQGILISPGQVRRAFARLDLALGDLDASALFGWPLEPGTGVDILALYVNGDARALLVGFEREPARSSATTSNDGAGDARHEQASVTWTRAVVLPGGGAAADHDVSMVEDRDAVDVVRALVDSLLEFRSSVESIGVLTANVPIERLANLQPGDEPGRVAFRPVSRVGAWEARLEVLTKLMEERDGIAGDRRSALGALPDVERAPERGRSPVLWTRSVELQHSLAARLREPMAFGHGYPGGSLDGAKGDPVLVVLAAGKPDGFEGLKVLAPVGPNDEAPLDLLISDAIVAGMRHLVLVVNSSTGPEVRRHVAHRWPRSMDFGFAEVAASMGTALALLAARRVLLGTEAMIVANVDNVYGAAPFEALMAQLHAEAAIQQGEDAGSAHAMVAFELVETLLSGAPVARDICRVDAEGWLLGLDPRRLIGVRVDGQLASADGGPPSLFAPDTPTAMDLWGFQSPVWDVLAESTEEVPSARDCRELDLADIVGRMVGRTAPTGASANRMRVLKVARPCIAVARPSDVQRARAALALEMREGLRPKGPWGRGGLRRAVG